MIRLFVGLELAEEQKAALQNVMHGISSIKWQRDDQLHLTLSFIGEVPKNIARDIAAGLASISFTPFDLYLSGVGLFGSLDKPRMLWSGVKDAAPLSHLHEKVERVLIGLGIEHEVRKYKPHVTLTRIRKRVRPFEIEQWMVFNDNFKAPALRVGYFTLFSSQLSHNGSYYDPEVNFAAQGGLMPELYEDSFDIPDFLPVKERYSFTP
jgi:RNA 2',3'-cyclic 3'-phosphodiesterase